jgi:hypothetical protein
MIGIEQSLPIHKFALELASVVVSMRQAFGFAPVSTSVGLNECGAVSAVLGSI